LKEKYRRVPGVLFRNDAETVSRDCEHGPEGERQDGDSQKNLEILPIASGKGAQDDEHRREYDRVARLEKGQGATFAEDGRLTIAVDATP
jgi:hypothetical protein